MITGSILLTLIAAASLVLGLVQGDEAVLYLSIVASVLAGLALFVGLRQSRVGRLPEDDFDLGPRRRRVRQRSVAAPVDRGLTTASIDAGRGRRRLGPGPTPH